MKTKPISSKLSKTFNICIDVVRFYITLYSVIADCNIAVDSLLFYNPQIHAYWWKTFSPIN
jgi:hypothetical protein